MITAIIAARVLLVEGKDEERVTFPTGTLEAHLAVKATIASALLFCRVLKLSIMVFPNLEFWWKLKCNKFQPPTIINNYNTFE
jgi:hypothetical protein